MATTVAAHNSKITTCNLSLFEGTWVMQLSFAQASLDAAMEKNFPREAYSELPEYEIKQWIVDYVRSRIIISIDAERLELGAGGILLGSHQTDLKFTIPDLPLFPDEMTIRVPICENSNNHTNLLRIYQGDQMSKFFLSADNDFEVKVRFEEDAVVAIEERPKSDLTKTLVILGIGGLLLLMLRFIPKFSASRS